MSRRFVLASLHASAALATVFAARTALAQSSTPSSPAAATAPVFANGMAQVVPAWRDSTAWIRYDLWVETDFDSDRDGRKDRVHVDVTRPAQTEGGGLKVPVLYGASPYFAGTSRDDAMWNVQQELGDQPSPRRALAAPVHQPNRRRISNVLVNEWVPRGFAVVHSEAPGTGLSQGCATVGDYPERAPMKFVIEWLNGRAKGFTSPTGREEVRATGWSTGKVGMIGTSYEGTLPLAAATTGVKGLEVVVPVAPNTSYYLYYRSNGLVRSPGGYLGEDADVLYDFVASGDPRTYADLVTQRGLAFIARYADGVGANKDLVIPRDEKGFLLEPTSLVEDAHAEGLLVHAFTFRSVAPALPPPP